MRSFFKMFFASLLSIIVFCLILLLFATLFINAFTSKSRPRVKDKTLLVLDLSQSYREQVKENPFAIITNGDEETPGIYDVVRLLNKAKTDKNISGIYVIANENDNGFATSLELRDALSDFKSGGKPVWAHGDAMSQTAYAVAHIADKIYISPQGMLEWFGLNVELAFIKGTLEKLDIQPQIFYAGKFKSATEPFRSEEMTPENELQTRVWINDLYSNLLTSVASARKVDTATLHSLADNATVRNAQDAVNSKLIDGLKYDDEVKAEIRDSLKIGKDVKINFLTINRYMSATNYKSSGSNKIALIHAEGNIVDGKGMEGMIGSEDFRELISTARRDKSVKAIVFRINSGGGSALASENIWRELSLAKKDKPVVISFGDVAASGGYYIATAGDSIFAQPTTITGSIGVFGIIPNMQEFFRNKLGITFDGVKTGPYADAGTFTRPMNEGERQLVQGEIDRIYTLFKKRVADGRKMDTAFVDSIAQGRIWTGIRAKELGLVDRFGGTGEALECAARMAKLSSYRVREYPEPVNILDKIFDKTNPLGEYESTLRSQIGEQAYRVVQELKYIKQSTTSIQARIPFTFTIK